MRHLQLAVRILFLVIVLGLFFLSIEMMGDAFKLFGKNTARQLLATTANPFAGLFAGILATTLVQSSSTVTSITVGMVAAQILPVPVAIPIVMGANIGTTITATIVAMGHVTRREEFRRALAGATVHDFLNFIAVAILFPLELATGYLNRASQVCAEALTGVGGLQLLSPIKALTGPLSTFILHLLGDSPVWGLVVALALLFVTLKQLVSLLRVLVLERAERVIHEYIFKMGLTSMVFGLLVTMLVQSSSITTSIAVPFVGAGILTVRQMFPYVCGANIGTTITSMMAALVLQDVNAIMVAFAHVFFNATGVALIYPVKRVRGVPIWLAERFGDLASKYRVYAIACITAVFYILPIVVLALVRMT